MTLVEPRTEPLMAWKYEGNDVFVLHEWQHAPKWVISCTIVLNNRLILDRPTGRQIINPGEWLVRSLDGEILWFETEEQMWTEYRRVKA